MIREFLLDDDRTGPLESLMFAVHMLVNTPAGRCHTFGEIREWLHRAGFGRVDIRPFDGAVGLVTGRRA